MRLFTVRHRDESSIAVGEGADTLVLIDRQIAPGMQAVIEAGAAGLDRIAASLSSAPRVLLTDVTVLPPLQPRRDIMCVGKNYHEHAAEFHRSGFDSTGPQAIPEAPVIFTKATTAVIANGETIAAGIDPTATVDYEGELGVVIGRRGRGISASKAYDAVFGYTIINDVTSRALQKKHSQWFIGKSLDTFSPMGPCIVTPDELGEIGAVSLVTTVNGEVRQNAFIRDLIFDIPTIIATLSETMTLVPGDVIATGTPSGVGIGFSPPRYLKTGDQVRIEISGIGALENPVG